MKKTFSLLSLILLFVTTSFGGPITSYTELKDKKILLLDIREKDEIKEGMIKGALWIPLSDLNSNPTKTITRLKELLNNKELHVYCRSGKRAKTFLSDIKSEGIKGFNFGGYSDLVSKGFPSEKP